MSTSIKPTVGRVVWFYPSTRTGSTDFSPPAAGQPLAAIVAAVLASSGVDIVNLAVFDAVGELHPETMVPLLQEGQDLPEDGFYATWMPYQIGQAKKAEDREHDAKQLAVAADRASDERRMRAGVLDMALRTPGLSGHDEVMKAAAAYQAHIEGQPAPGSIETKTYADGTKATGPAPLPDVSPADRRLFSGLPFGEALLALKRGHRVARAGWNGKGMWLALTGKGGNWNGSIEGGAMPQDWQGFLPFIGMYTADKHFVPWLASQTDALAEDWLIVE